jgi:hypothetical protein
VGCAASLHDDGGHGAVDEEREEASRRSRWLSATWPWWMETAIWKTSFAMSTALVVGCIWTPSLVWVVRDSSLPRRCVSGQREEESIPTMHQPVGAAADGMVAPPAGDRECSAGVGM